MKQTLKLFQIGLRQTIRDGMLLLLLPAPLLIGALVKWGVPLLSGLSERQWGLSLLPWYRLIDGFMLTLIPSMLSIISAFLLLEERDEGTGAYVQITPAQGGGYLLARLGLPMGGAFLYAVLTGMVFGISGLDAFSIVCMALTGTGAGLACALMIAALANNRVEGLAMSKLMGLSLLGLFAPWFLPPPASFLAAFLPSYWIGAMMQKGIGLPPLIGGFLSSALWILIFGKRFLRRMH